MKIQEYIWVLTKTPFMGKSLQQLWTGTVAEQALKGIIKVLMQLGWPAHNFGQSPSAKSHFDWLKCLSHTMSKLSWAAISLPAHNLEHGQITVATPCCYNHTTVNRECDLLFWQNPLCSRVGTSKREYKQMLALLQKQEHSETTNGTTRNSWERHHTTECDLPFR